MSHVLLLDSNVWSHLILGDAAKREKVKAQLAALRVKYPGAVKATSAICVAECLVAVRRLADNASALQFEALLQTEFSSPDVIVVEVIPFLFQCNSSYAALLCGPASSSRGRRPWRSMVDKARTLDCRASLAMTRRFLANCANLNARIEMEME